MMRFEVPQLSEVLGVPLTFATLMPLRYAT